MAIFYSPSTKGFYHEEVHGKRKLIVPDPAFRYSDEPGAQAEPDYIEEANPDCQIPTDAVEITAELHAKLLEGQGAGKMIVAGKGGFPELQEPPGPSKEQHSANLRAARNHRLASCDWTQIPDADLNESQRAAWKKYRQALRDLPDTTKDHAKVVWPTPPA